MNILKFLNNVKVEVDESQRLTPFGGFWFISKLADLLSVDEIY